MKDIVAKLEALAAQLKAGVPQQHQQQIAEELERIARELDSTTGE